MSSPPPWASAARRLDAWLFGPESPYPSAAFRILLGIYLLAYFGSLAPHTELLFSDQGVYAPLKVPDYAPPPPLAWLAMIGLVALSLALLVGWKSAWVVPALLGMYAYHYFLALGVKHSTFERLIAIYLLALCFGRADAVWCLAPPASSSGRPASSTRFTGRLVRFQTVMLYLGAGLWKLGNPHWLSPDLLRSTLQGIWAGPLGFRIAQLNLSDEAWVLAARAIAYGELVLAACLFIPRLRPVGIALGVAFHLANSFVLVIPEFLVCLVPYAYFVRPSTLERIAPGERRSYRVRPASRRVRG